MLFLIVFKKLLKIDWYIYFLINLMGLGIILSGICAYFLIVRLLDEMKEEVGNFRTLQSCRRDLACELILLALCER